MKQVGRLLPDLKHGAEPHTPSSTPTSKPDSSSHGTKARDTALQTGTPHSNTGLAVQQQTWTSAVDRPQGRRPEYTGMSEGLQSCARQLERTAHPSYDGWVPSIVSMEQLGAAYTEAKALSEETSSSKELAAMFEIVCQALHCEAPGEFALAIYFEVLKEMPASTIRPAMVHLLSSYKYRRFPTLAEFVAAFQPLVSERKRISGMIQYEIWRRVRALASPSNPV